MGPKRDLVGDLGKAVRKYGLKYAPSNLGKSKYAWVFEIVTDTEQHTPNAIQADADKAFE